MIRKWSYINPFFNEKYVYTPSYSLKVKNRHVFKVFRQGTRFKKWQLGLTITLVRRKYIRRKHLTNNLVYTQISSTWASFYLKQRKFISFYHSLSLLPFVFTSSFNKTLTSSLSSNSPFLQSMGFLIYKNSHNLRYLNFLTFFGLKNLYWDFKNTIKHSYQTSLYVYPINSINNTVEEDLSQIEQLNKSKPMYLSRLYSEDSFSTTHLSKTLKTLNSTNFYSAYTRLNLKIIESIYLISKLLTLYVICKYNTKLK